MYHTTDAVSCSKVTQERQDEPAPSELKPSEVIDAYWLGAECKTSDFKKPTERAGKWLVYLSIAWINEYWAKVKKATEEGKLGYSAKVSTARPNPLASSKARVIVVYTYDWKDEEDVFRVREALRRLGIVRKISYKTNADTLAGKYKQTTAKRISKYYD
jgi:hypothetical protein